VLLAELQGRDAPWDAAAGFEQMAGHGAPAVKRLAKLLASPTSETRLFAASSLAGIGTASSAALPELRALLNDPDNDVREVAAEAIRKIESSARK